MRKAWLLLLVVPWLAGCGSGPGLLDGFFGVEPGSGGVSGRAPVDDVVDAANEAAGWLPAPFNYAALLAAGGLATAGAYYPRLRKWQSRFSGVVRSIEAVRAKDGWVDLSDPASKRTAAMIQGPDVQRLVQREKAKMIADGTSRKVVRDGD